MFGLGRLKPIAEHEATGEIERVYHEIRQTMRANSLCLTSAKRSRAICFHSLEASSHLRNAFLCEPLRLLCASAVNNSFFTTEDTKDTEDTQRFKTASETACP